MPGLRRLQPAAEKRFRATHASVGTADMNSLVSPLSAFSPLLFFFVALLSLLQRQKKCQEPPTYLQPLRGNSSNLFNTTLPLHSDHVLLPCQSLLGFQKLERAATELAEILFEHFLELLGNKKKKKKSFAGALFQALFFKCAALSGRRMIKRGAKQFSLSLRLHLPHPSSH